MATLIQITDDDVKCSECDTIFFVVLHRNVVYDRLEFCPFCGSEISYHPTERTGRDE